MQKKIISDKKIPELAFILLVFIFSVTFGLFYSPVYVGAASLSDTIQINQGGNTSNVKANSLQGWRDEHCARYNDATAGGQAGGYNPRSVCEEAYVAGYNDSEADSTDRDGQCSGKGVNVCEPSYDAGALLQRNAAIAANQVSDEKIDDGAATFCAGKSNTKPSAPAGNAGRNQSSTERLSPKEACLKGFKAGAKNQGKDATCGSYSGTTKDECEAGYEAGNRLAQGKNPAGPSSSSSSNSDDANCSGGGALGWIICPVSELIANFATDMFEDIIAPMLENVPISTDRTEGGFQAWQSLRVIANALLIVSLLAVVYAQAKGGD